ncbi:hypothetical protein B0H14DRAFT_3144079 [Mycena olivaceomarginata]|nr:hypothetical protein B0H14DRAFT_3144079 [Mycena olivaceomarginata]
MENKPGDATSAVFKDKNGVTLACVFARRSLNAMKIHGAYPGTVGRTWWNIFRSQHAMRTTTTASMNLYQENVGSNADPSFRCTTHHSERDVRHNDEKYMVYIPSGNTPEKSERAGSLTLFIAGQCRGIQKDPSCHQAIFLEVARRRWRSNITIELRRRLRLSQLHVRGCVPRVPCQVHGSIQSWRLGDCRSGALDWKSHRIQTPGIGAR